MSLNPDQLLAKLERERLARKQAERLLEEKSLELFNANQILKSQATSLENEVNKRTEELQNALRLAQSATQAKTEFLAMMSHEIRTPLNAIFGFTELAFDEELPARSFDYLTKIQQASKSLQATINDILDFSKIEAGKISIETHPFYIEDLLKDLRDLFASPAAAKGIELFIQPVSQLPVSVNADMNRIRQILVNFIGNAIKFTEQGEILLRIESIKSSNQSHALQFQVQDTGIGLSIEAQQQLFQPFSQADSSISRRFGGTGLGLAICKKLVHLMLGEISVTSEPGKGSTFSFTVPVSHVSYAPTPSTQNFPNGRVLIVDDMQTSCLILKTCLENWGMTVDICFSGEAAISKVVIAESTSKPYDFLLLDWQMPGLDGLQLYSILEKMELSGQLKQFPVAIMVSDYSRHGLLQKIQESDCQPNAILTKPVSISDLFNTISNIFNPNAQIQKPKDVQKISLSDLSQPIQGCYILLAEDNTLNQQIFNEFLKKAGLRLVLAENGKEAVDWVKREKFDAILLDVQMPVMDGLEAAKQIRKLPFGATTPIIALTAATLEDNREDCLRAGMDDHLGKPVKSQQLIEKLVHWISGSVKESSSAFVPVSNLEDELELEGFDFTEVMSMLGNDRQQIIELLFMFYEDTGQTLQDISELMSQGHLSQMAELLHKSAGMCGSIGAMVLYQHTKQLEDHIKTDHPHEHSLTEWINCVHKTRNTVAHFLKKQSVRL